MKITEDSEAKLVIRGNSFWVFFPFIFSTFLMITVVGRHPDPFGNLGAYFVLGIFFLVGAIYAEAFQFEFDRIKRSVLWTKRGLTGITSGLILFEEIQDIAIESKRSKNGQVYRLNLVSGRSKISLGKVFTLTQISAEKIRKRILEVVKNG